MKPAKYIILSVALLWAIVAGFFSSYLIMIFVIVLLLTFNLLNVLDKEEKNNAKIILCSISIISSVVSFHVGILLTNNLRQVCFDNPPADFSEHKLNTHPVSVENIESSLSLDADFKLDTLENFTFNNKDYFIKRISPKKKNGKIKILLLAGMHGSEAANIYAIMKIFEKIKVEKLSEEFHFDIIYALNPVGLSRFNRFNECHCDINRDFKLFKTLQSRLLRDLIQNEKYNFVLDLHEGFYDGHYFINNTSQKNLSKDINVSLDRNKIKKSPMLTNSIKDFLFRYKVDNRLYNNAMTFDSYLTSLNIENILSESDGLSRNLDQRINGHLIVFDKLIESIGK